MKMKKTALAAALASLFLPLGAQAASYQDVADTTESPIRIVSSLEDPDITITGSTQYKPAVSASKDHGDEISTIDTAPGGTILIQGSGNDVVSAAREGVIHIGSADTEQLRVKGVADSATMSAQHNLVHADATYLPSAVPTVELNAKSILLQAPAAWTGTLGAVVKNDGGQVSVGSAVTDSLQIEAATAGNFRGVWSVGGETRLDGRVISISSSFVGVQSAQSIDRQSRVIIGSSATEQVDIHVDSRSNGVGIWNLAGSSLDVLGKEIDISGSQNAVLNKSGTVVVGSDTTQSVILTSSDAESATLETSAGGKTTVHADTVTVNAADAGISANEGTISIEAEKTLNVVTTGGYGIHVQGNDEAQAEERSAFVNINAGHTVVTAANGAALLAFSNGELNVDGDLTVTASTAIEARGNATVNINQTGADTVVMTGDIIFATPGPTEESGSRLNAKVNLNLKGEGSSWKGNAAKLAPNSVHPEDQTITGFNMTLADGAVWNATAIDLSLPDGVEATAEQEKVTNLTLSDGVITLADAAATAKIGTLSGTGGTVNAAVIETNGTLSSAKVSVDAVSETDAAPTLTVNYTGITSDYLTAENIEGLDAVTGEGSDKLAHVEKVAAGDIRGAWVRTTDVDGTVRTVESANPKLSDYSAVNAMSLVEWRNEINRLTKRLGDVRASASEVGAWARVYGGESKWGEAAGVKMDHASVQVGADRRVSPNWIVGGAFSYTNSDADLSTGSAEGDMYSLALYATRMTDNGAHIDAIARYGYLENDISAGNMDVDTSNHAFSLSIESGHQFRFIGDRGYVEPQVELTYGFVRGDDATASNGVRVEQDDYQNLITRVGLRTGFDFPEKAGTLYATVSYSYDFLGDADGTASKMLSSGLEKVSLDEDLGGGWVTYGIGTQFRLGKNAFAYGELERTTGGEIEHPYLFNVGLRYSF